MLQQDSSHLLSSFSQPVPGQIGTWRLMPKQAMGMRTRRPGQILVVGAQAWITWAGPCSAQPARDRDHVLSAGEVLAVPAGVRLVLEPAQSAQALDFEWRALPAEAFWRADLGSWADAWSGWTWACRQWSWFTLALGRQLWRHLRRCANPRWRMA